MSRIKEPIEVVKRKAARGETLTANERRRLDKWWANQRSNPVTPQTDGPKAYAAKSFGFDIPQTSGLRCFKCGTPLHEVTATFGKIPRFTKIDVVDWDTKRFETKIYAKNEKVAACSECCLLIKPLKDKAHALDFRSYE